MERLQSIIEYFRKNPAALDGSAVHVEFVETHISAVLMTERLVFKFKKPVDFPFIHQASFTERLANCMREVEFNLRLAPDVYVAVRGVHDMQDGSYALLPSTRGAVDACVVMHRLNERTNLLSRLRDPASQDMLVDALERTAVLLADFHAETIGNPMTAALHSFQENLLDDLEALSDVPAFQGSGLCARVRTFSDRFRDNVQRRDRSSAVVNGHGDLRLDHIYLDQDNVRIIDCVEFNPRIRAVDPWEDIAFTTMSLRFEGRDDLAVRLASAYASASLDVRGLTLLPLFEIYRATVRAKIDSINIKNKTGSVQRFQKRLERYAAVCEEILSAPPRPLSIDVVFGLPASGKSTRALALSREKGAVVISTDLARKRLAGRARHARMGESAFSGIYSARFTSRTYHAVHGLAARALSAGYPVVLDGTYAKESDREEACRLAERFGAPIRFHWLHADEGTIQKRLAERAARNSVSEMVDFATWLKVKAGFEPLSAAVQKMLSPGPA